MLLDKNNIDSAIVSYILDGFPMTAKVWSYEGKATIFVLDKDAKYNQDFYYVLKGAMPNVGTSIESMNAEMFSNPFDAYARFQDLLNESQEEEQKEEEKKQQEEQKIPILLKNKKTNQVQFREVDSTLVVGNDVLAEGFIVDNGKINLSSDDTFETKVFVNGEEFEAILLKLSKLDKDGKDGYFIIPKQPNSQNPQDDGKPEDGKPEDGKPEDGKPEDGKPEDGKPEDGKPEDGKPEDGKPEDGKPDDGKPDDGKPEDGKPEDGKPEDGKPEDGKPEDGKPEDGKPDDGKPEDGKPEDGKPEDGKPDDGKPEDGKPEDGKPDDGKPKDGEPPQGGDGPITEQPMSGEPPEIKNEILSDRVRIISEVSGIDQDIVKNNFRNVNLAVNFLSGINYKELQNRLNTDKTAYQLAQEVAQEIRNS